MSTAVHAGWPVHPQSRGREVLTSWIARAAYGHGLDGRTFCRLLWRDAAGIVRHDVDRAADAGLLRPLTEAVGRQPGFFHNMTIAAFRGVLFAADDEVWTSPWVLSQSRVRHRPRRFGQQVCPRCLAEDDPYWPVWWRLGFVSCCLRHRCVLIDRCPECATQLSALQGRVPDHPLRHCYRCRTPLWTAATEPCKPGAARLQAQCIAAAERGFAGKPDGTPVPALRFFACLHRLLLGIRRARGELVLDPMRRSDTRARVRVRFNGHLFQFNHLPPRGRHRLFAMVSELMEADPARLVLATDQIRPSSKS